MYGKDGNSSHTICWYWTDFPNPFKVSQKSRFVDSIRYVMVSIKRMSGLQIRVGKDIIISSFTLILYFNEPIKRRCSTILISVKVEFPSTAISVTSLIYLSVARYGNVLSSLFYIVYDVKSKKSRFKND